MTIAERNNKLKHYITCLKCGVSGKECDDNCATQYEAGTMGEIIENLESISKILEQEPRWIPVSERLPEDKEIILITSSDMYLSKLNPWCGWKNRNNWYTFTANGSYLIKYPFAWMPLPKSYEEVTIYE